MTLGIERDVTVSWRHQVLFTQNIFDAENAVLRDTLADDPAVNPRKVLLVLDEGLAEYFSRSIPLKNGAVFKIQPAKYKTIKLM